MDMWKKLGQASKEAILSYISKEKEINLFIHGDLENESLDSKNLSAFFLYEDDVVNCLVIRYIHHFVVYSPARGFDAEEVAAFLSSFPALSSINGKGELIEALEPYLPSFALSKDTMLCLHKRKIEVPPLKEGLRFKKIEGKEEEDQAARLLITIEEFSSVYCGCDAITRLRRAKDGIKEKNGHYNMGVYEGDELIAIASLTARTSEAAMVVGVATKEGFRGQGIASSLVSELTREAFEEMGISYLCLFYDNPIAKKIYDRLGFEELGPYYILTKQAEETL